MKNEEILEAAIKKAVKNGWDLFGWEKFQVVMGGIGMWSRKSEDYISRKYGEIYSDETIIFHHDFAKSFFVGELCTCTPDTDTGGNIYHKPNCKITTPDWRCHLQKMVLEEDPIKYLEQFLK